MLFTRIICLVCKHQFSFFFAAVSKKFQYMISFTIQQNSKSTFFSNNGPLSSTIKIKIEWTKNSTCDWLVITLIQVSIGTCMQMLKQLYPHEANNQANNYRTGLTTKQSKNA